MASERIRSQPSYNRSRLPEFTEVTCRHQDTRSRTSCGLYQFWSTPVIAFQPMYTHDCLFVIQPFIRNNVRPMPCYSRLWRWFHVRGIQSSPEFDWPSIQHCSSGTIYQTTDLSMRTLLLTIADAISLSKQVKLRTNRFCLDHHAPHQPYLYVYMVCCVYVVALQAPDISIFDVMRCATKPFVTAFLQLLSYEGVVTCAVSHYTPVSQHILSNRFPS